MSGGASPSTPERVFYDGTCGVCHKSVRYVLKRDQDGSRFEFAPLLGPTYEAEVPASLKSERPDSMIVKTREGEWLLRSNAVIHILRRLGGVSAFLGNALRILPRPIRDFAYRAFAQIRKAFTKPPTSTCPILAPELRRRFLP